MEVEDWEIDGLEEERQREARRKKNAAFRRRLDEQKKQADTGQTYLKVAAVIACVSWTVAIARLWS